MMGREGGMPRERSDMRRIREVLRLREEFGASVRRIAAACRMPRTTVRDYLRRLERAELRFGAVRERRGARAATVSAAGDAVTAAAGLGGGRTRTGPTGRDAPTALAGVSGLPTRRLPLHPVRPALPGLAGRPSSSPAAARPSAGRRAGSRLRRHDPDDRDRRRGASGAGLRRLPYSGYIYAEATWTQRSEDWLASHVRLLEH